MIHLIAGPEAAHRSLETLGLDPTVISIDSPESLANAVRRAASFLCPTTPRQIRQAVVESLEWLIASTEQSLRDDVDKAIEALIGYGDLRELRPPVGVNEGELLFLAPPAFVSRRQGRVVILGIRPEGEPLLPIEVLGSLQHERHLKYLPGPLTPDVLEVLEGAGLQQLRMESWLTAPRPQDSSDLIAAYDARLVASPVSGDIDGLRILDPTTPNAFYIGRWREPTGRDSGRFVARRPRRYGAAAWCYVELSEGDPTALIDLPVSSPLARGCDEAWRLQAAIDAQRGHPQEVSCTQNSGAALVRLTSPPPSWLQRRLDMLGTPLLQQGALVAYALPPPELDEELEFMRRMLWIKSRR